jgi:tetratricopeptide (TPR) repeat protein
MTKVFISYRRADSSPYTGRLRDRMVEVFGEDNVFMDVDSIAPGVDFDELVRTWVESCDLLLAVIGPQWLQVRNADGKRRLDDPKDIVRHEIATALRRDITVIPVLMGGAVMPAADDLPEPIEELARRNAVEVRDTSFNDDVARLIKRLPKRPLIERIGWTVKAVIVAIVLALVAYSGFLMLPEPPVVAGFEVRPGEPDANQLLVEGNLRNTSGWLALPRFGLIASATAEGGKQPVFYTSIEEEPLAPGAERSVALTLDTSPLDVPHLEFTLALVTKEKFYTNGPRNMFRNFYAEEQSGDVQSEGENEAAHSEAELKEKLARTKRNYGTEDNADVAAAMDELASFYVDRGRYKDAVPLYERILAIRESLFSDDQLYLADNLYDLGRVYFLDGRLEEAVSLLERLVGIAADEMGPDHPELARFRVDLAKAYVAKGSYELAERLCTQAFEAREQVLGPDNLEIAALRVELAETFLDQGADEADERAVALYQQALETRRKLLGPEHIQIATTLGDLARIHLMLDRKEEAKQLFERALEIAEKTFGPQNLAVAKYHIDLAGITWSLDDTASAEQHYRTAIEIKQKELGPKHPDVAPNLLSLKGLYMSQKKARKAAELDDIVRAIEAASEQPEKLVLRAVANDEEVERLIEEVRTLRTLPGDPRLPFYEATLGVFRDMGQKRAVAFFEDSHR